MCESGGNILEFTHLLNVYHTRILRVTVRTKRGLIVPYGTILTRLMTESLICLNLKNFYAYLTITSVVFVLYYLCLSGAVW